MPFIDRVVASWYTSAHPQSHFRDRVAVAKALPEGRRATLLNREFTIRERDGKASTRTIESPAEWLHVVAESFGLELTLADVAHFEPCGFSS